MTCRRCGGELPYEPVSDKPDPGYQARQHTAEECLGVLRAVITDCRPHVVMSKSATSGREFQEKTQRLIDRIDRVAQSR